MVISSDAVSGKEKAYWQRRKKRHHHHPHGDGRPPGKVSAHKARKSGTIPLDQKQAPYRKADLVSRTNYTIRKAPYAHLDFTMRQTLEQTPHLQIRQMEVTHLLTEEIPVGTMMTDEHSSSGNQPAKQQIPRRITGDGSL